MHNSLQKALMRLAFIEYSYYLPVYYPWMTNRRHRGVFQAFFDGHFIVQLSNNNPFAPIPIDQTTEVNLNKDIQTPDGTTRFRLNQVQRTGIISPPNNSTVKSYPELGKPICHFQ